ncbi:MAG: MobF family relaxase, partial [Gemmataceae bacterium]
MSVNVKKIRKNGLYLLKQEAENRRNPSPVFDLLQGRFLGEGAKALEIDGQPIIEEVFKRLNDGWSPDGERKLVRNADSPTRCRGWMVSVGPHKSVSNLLMLYRPKEWRDIVRCHQLAARAALRCMDMFCGVGRRDGQGVREERSGLVVATCTHLANDRAEPHLHDHFHVFNLVHHPSDNTFGALKSKFLYALARAIDAVYQKELSTLLRERLGIVTTRDRFATRVVGVPDAVIQATSTRSADITRFAGPREGRSAKLAEYAAELTRGQKRFPTVAQLDVAWRSLADALQFTQGTVVRRPNKPMSPTTAEPIAARAVRSAAERLAQESGTFTRWDLLARSLVGTIGKAIPYERVMGQVRRVLERPGVSKLVRLGKEPASERLYTTESHLLLEARFLRLLDQLATTKRRPIRAGLVDRIISQNLRQGDGRFLSDE